MAGLLVSTEERALSQAVPDDYYYAAIGMMAQGKDAEAIQYFEATLKLDPNHVKAWKKMAEAQKNLSRYRAAISSLEKALSLAPDDPDIAPAIADLRPLASASTSKDKGLAAVGEAEKPIQNPGFSFTLGTGLSMYRDGDIARHLTTSFFFLRNGTWVQGVVAYVPKNTIFGKGVFAPTLRANYVSVLATGQIDRPNMGIRARAEAAGRKKLSDDFYLKIGGSISYHAFEESGYDAQFTGGLVDEDGFYLGAHPSGPDPAVVDNPAVRISEKWGGNAVVLGFGPSLGLSELDIDNNVLINFGSVGVEFLFGLGNSRYNFAADSMNLNTARTAYDVPSSVRQEANLSGVGLGLGLSVEVVKNFLGIPFSIRAGQRWLTIGPLKGTFETDDNFTGNAAGSTDVVGVVVPAASDFNSAYLEWGDTIYFLKDGETLPDGTRNFKIDLSGFEFEFSIRFGF